MKKINYVKIILDTIMVVVFVLLFNKMVLGMLFHEVAGLAIGAVILIHCSLNWKWIKGITLKIFKRKMITKVRLGYFIDILLLVNVIIIIVSGVFISKTLFSSLHLNGAQYLKAVHISLSYFSLLLIGIHVGLHWNWVMITFKKIFRIPIKKKIYSFVSKFLIVLLLAFGGYSTYSVGFLSKISITPIISSLTSPGSGNEMDKREFKTNDETNRPVKIEGETPKGKDRLKGDGFKETSVLGVISSYLGVISLFSIITYYSEKILAKKKNDF